MESDLLPRKHKYSPDNKHKIITHNVVVYHIAEKYNLDPKKVNQTIRSFFSKRGIRKHMAMGSTIIITGFGMLRPNVIRLAIMRRMPTVIRARNRLKKKRQVSK